MAERTSAQRRHLCERAFRGARRTRLRTATAAAGLCLWPAAGLAATFVVNSTLDATDVLPGNGACSPATAVCTLRAAVQEANALPGTHVIVLPAGIYRLTIPGRGEVRGATGDLDIISGNKDVTIN